jgi:hypothetical protein
MLILHAAFNEDRLVIWGEIPATPEVRGQRVSKGRLKASKPPPLHYDAGKAKLSEALNKAGCVAMLFLPTRKPVRIAISPLARHYRAVLGWAH